MAAAAELFDHHAFVDLETTGLDPARDRVIEVGVLFIHQGRPAEQISKLFGAPAPLPLSIRRLTGIEDGDLAGQPAFEEFLPKLRAALAGWTVVAHNASFERGFLAELLQEIDAPVLDSCELLHYVYPELASYSLDSMIRWTGVGHGTAHRALKDCEDTFAMLCRALHRCTEEQRAEELDEVLHCLAPGGSACANEPLVALLSKLVGLCRNGARAEGPLPADEGNDAGACPTALAATEAAEWMVAALERKSVSAIELAPGLSRQACLQAAASVAKRAGSRVSLAIGSDGRPGSLLEAELPAPASVRACYLDEQQRYLCRRRALAASQTELKMSHDERAPRAYLRAFLRRSPTGEIARLSHWFKIRYPLLQRLAWASQSEPATTLASRCPHYGACFYHSALTRAKEADLLVVRHASLAEWPPDYPPSRHVLIDEAHRLESALFAALARELSNDSLCRLADRLLGVGGRGGLLRSIESEVAAGPEGEALGPHLRAATAVCQRIGLQADRLGAALAALMPPLKDALHRRELLLDAPLLLSARWELPRALLGELKEQVSELRLHLSALREALPFLGRADLERDLGGALADAGAATESADQIDAPRAERCRFASTDRLGNAWKLRSEPLEASEAFTRLAAERSVVLTSPALSVGGNPWVLDRLGVRTVVHRTRRPVAGHQPLVLIISDAPRPFDEDFFPWASSRIGGIATFVHGRLMALFSSLARLAQMEERLRPALEATGIEAIRVSRARRDGSAVASAGGRVLFGGRGVWHQRELARELACIFIDKLPTEPLSRPSVAAREVHAARQCKDARYSTMPYRLPNALVLLRQWLSTCAERADERLVVILAHAGAPEHQDAAVEALEAYQPAVVPWSMARLRIYDALRPLAVPRPESRVRSAAGS